MPSLDDIFIMYPHPTKSELVIDDDLYEYLLENSFEPTIMDVPEFVEFWELYEEWKQEAS